MIVDGLIHAILGIVSNILSVFPSLPSMDVSIVTAGAWLSTTLAQGAAFAQFIYGSTLYHAIIALVAAVWAFEPIYHTVMWVIKKIPIINVK